MANTNKPFGLAPVRSISGTWSEQATRYYIYASDTDPWYIGDACISAAQGDAPVHLFVEDIGPRNGRLGDLVGQRFQDRQLGRNLGTGHDGQQRTGRRAQRLAQRVEFGHRVERSHVARLILVLDHAGFHAVPALDHLVRHHRSRVELLLSARVERLGDLRQPGARLRHAQRLLIALALHLVQHVGELAERLGVELAVLGIVVNQRGTVGQRIANRVFGPARRHRRHAQGARQLGPGGVVERRARGLVGLALGREVAARVIERARADGSGATPRGSTCRACVKTRIWQKNGQKYRRKP